MSVHALKAFWKEAFSTVDCSASPHTGSDHLEEVVDGNMMKADGSLMTNYGSQGEFAYYFLPMLKIPSYINPASSSSIISPLINPFLAPVVLHFEWCSSIVDFKRGVQHFLRNDQEHNEGASVTSDKEEQECPEPSCAQGR